MQKENTADSYHFFLNSHTPDDGLVRLALDDIQSSGLSPEILKQAEVKIFNGNADLLKERLGRTSINGHSLLKEFRLSEFPHFGEDGTVLLYRYKVIPTTTDQDGKEIKYLHPAGTPAVPYILPVVWKVKDKTNQPIWITEGEKKTLALIQHGLNAIGLSGVWNFKSSNNPGDTDLFSELKDFQWRGRTVFLAFDSDLLTNLQVRYAFYELSFKLFDLGAVVKIVTWDGAKGIDDLLSMKDNPTDTLQSIKSNATGLLDFMNPDHEPEIIRAISLLNDEIGKERLSRHFAKKIGIRPQAVREAIAQRKENNETDDILENIEPWDHPVDGNSLLNEIVGVFRRYVVLPIHADMVAGLYVLLTYLVDVLNIVPILGIKSPDKRCGKSTFLNVFLCLCFRALIASNISPSAIFRSVDKWKPTLIIDEMDTFLPQNEGLRGILNSGHLRHTAYVIRSDGKDFEPRRFSTYCAKILAAIGLFPPTVADRSITISLERKRTSEKVDKIGIDGIDRFLDLRRKCLRWAIDNKEKIRGHEPEIPEGLHDRESDNWQPLLSIAEVIGGSWPEKVRRAATAMSDKEADDAAGVLLLTDIQEYFKTNNTDRVHSQKLVEFLIEKEDRPWPEWVKDKPITTRQVAALLHPFNVKPKPVRIGDEVKRGYEKEFFKKVFSRYIPPISSVTTLQPNNINELGGFSTVTGKNIVTDKKAHNPLINKDCNVVTDKKGGTDEIIEIEGELLSWK